MICYLLLLSDPVPLVFFNHITRPARGLKYGLFPLHETLKLPSFPFHNTPMKSTPIPPSQHVLLSRKSLRSKTALVTIADFTMTPHSPFPLHVQHYFRTHRSPRLCHIGGVQIHPLKTYENIVDRMLGRGEAVGRPVVRRKGLEAGLGRRKVERRETVLVRRSRAESEEADIREEEKPFDMPVPSLESSLLRDWLHKEQEKSQIDKGQKTLKRARSIPHYALPISPSSHSTHSKPLKLPTRTHSDFVVSIPFISSSNSTNTSPIKEKKPRRRKEELLKPVLGAASRLNSRRSSQMESDMERLDVVLSP